MTQNTGSISTHSAELRFAMNLSFGFGVLMFIGKSAAWWLTGSAAILSDAAESVVHVVAVAFAAFSLRLSEQPADENHHYGHGKIAFFSAGFEGAMIVIAALFILYAAIEKLIFGPVIEQLGWGVLLTSAAALINGALGAYLLNLGRRRHSLILEANGKHVLTDFWTSAGVVLALALIWLTGWAYWDPIFAIALALNILYSGFNLMRNSLSGLMDVADAGVHQVLETILAEETTRQGLTYHDLRHRFTGEIHEVELHLVFPELVSLREAHRMATVVEKRIEQSVEPGASVTTHLEPAESHDRDHEEGTPDKGSRSP